jgi:phospho-N-acetylmuramoyl-pentapeptide-transferase
MLVTIGFGAISWVDDWRKVVNHKNPEGMPSGEVFLAVGDRAEVARRYLAFSVGETSNLRVLELVFRWCKSASRTKSCRRRLT